ncbi:MAG: hypothetical protein MUF84_15280 [Anaerolineae bacterium]|jgi:hypothetical protein|nr:hypothetical protein [Anaerolineae bacterium]
MTVLPPDPALAQFIKPTLDTPFHIDYAWWEKQGLDINVKLVSHLCPEHREAFAGQPMDEKIDWIDWATGEVTRVDGLQYVITSHCSKQPGYLMQAPTLIEGIFRALLVNANKPLTPRRLAPMVGHQPDQVLRVLASRTVRLGLRPILKVG